MVTLGAQLRRTAQGLCGPAGSGNSRGRVDADAFIQWADEEHGLEEPCSPWLSARLQRGLELTVLAARVQERLDVASVFPFEAGDAKEFQVNPLVGELIKLREKMDRWWDDYRRGCAEARREAEDEAWAREARPVLGQVTGLVDRAVRPASGSAGAAEAVARDAAYAR